jgi:DNA ligase-1
MKIKPMLAYKVDAKPIDWSENVFMQPKLDGVRCIIQTDDQGKVIAYSRTGKPWLNINHILKDLKPFFDQQPDVILDGELYNHDLRDDFEQIISLVRTQKPSPYVRSKSKKLVQFHCYDYANGSDSYKTRMDNLAVASFYSYCVKYVPTSVVYHYNHAQLKHQAFLERGYEGSILRLNKPYEQKRSYSLQKFKDFHDAEATIIGYLIATATQCLKRYVIMSKLIYQLYNDNMISEEVVHLLLDAYYNRRSKRKY